MAAARGGRRPPDLLCLCQALPLEPTVFSGLRQLRLLPQLLLLPLLALQKRAVSGLGTALQRAGPAFCQAGPALQRAGPVFGRAGPAFFLAAQVSHPGAQALCRYQRGYEKKRWGRMGSRGEVLEAECDGEDEMEQQTTEGKRRHF